MATAYRELADPSNGTDLSRDEWLGQMLHREAAPRSDKRLSNRLAASKLRLADACIEDIDLAATAVSTAATRFRWRKGRDWRKFKSQAGVVKGSKSE